MPRWWKRSAEVALLNREASESARGRSCDAASARLRDVSTRRTRPSSRVSPRRDPCDLGWRARRPPTSRAPSIPEREFVILEESSPPPEGETVIPWDWPGFRVRKDRRAGDVATRRGGPAILASPTNGQAGAFSWVSCRLSGSPDDRVALSREVSFVDPFSAALVFDKKPNDVERQEIVILERVVPAEDDTICMSKTRAETPLLDVLSRARGVLLPPEPSLVFALRTLDVPTLVVPRDSDEEQIATWMEIAFGVDRARKQEDRSQLVTAMRCGDRGLLGASSLDLSWEAQASALEILASELGKAEMS